MWWQLSKNSAYHSGTVQVTAIYSILGVHYFGESDPQIFGNFASAMFTMFQVVTDGSLALAACCLLLYCCLLLAALLLLAACCLLLYCCVIAA